MECCFVDDKDDVNLYNYKNMARAITEGILNKSLEEKKYKIVLKGSYEKAKADKIVKVIKDLGYTAEMQ